MNRGLVIGLICFFLGSKGVPALIHVFYLVAVIGAIKYGQAHP